MKIITFKKELIPLIQRGSKTQTRRLHKYKAIADVDDADGQLSVLMPCRYAKGDICRIQTSRFIPTDKYGYIIIKDISAESLNDIPDDDIKAEGFTSRAGFMEAFLAINGLVAEPCADYKVWKITFKYHKYARKDK